VNKQVETQTFKDVFLNVSALYAILRGTPQDIVINKQGKVVADPIYFLADVEIKAKRTLSPLYYKVFLQLAENGDYGMLPIDLQNALGEAFLRGDLNLDGAYRYLYYRAKNDRLMDRDEPTHFPEEIENNES
jgi:hypothetical protein